MTKVFYDLIMLVSVLWQALWQPTKYGSIEKRVKIVLK